MPKSVPLRAIVRHQRGVFDSVGGVGQRFTSCHAKVEEKLIIAGHKLRHSRQRRRVCSRTSQMRHQRPSQQCRGSDIALVHLVTHTQRLGHERPEIDTPRGSQGRAEQWPRYWQRAKASE